MAMAYSFIKKYWWLLAVIASIVVTVILLIQAQRKLDAIDNAIYKTNTK